MAGLTDSYVNVILYDSFCIFYDIMAGLTDSYVNVILYDSFFVYFIILWRGLLTRM
jgi:hypothetical protein